MNIYEAFAEAVSREAGMAAATEDGPSILEFCCEAIGDFRLLPSQGFLNPGRDYGLIERWAIRTAVALRWLAPRHGLKAEAGNLWALVTERQGPTYPLTGDRARARFLMICGRLAGVWLVKDQENIAFVEAFSDYALIMARDLAEIWAAARTIAGMEPAKGIAP
jgi:hypothetical protein